MQGLGICVDYDDTFSTNPEVWTKIIELMRGAGANVVCITARFPDCPLPPNFPGEVHYARGQPKAEFAKENGLKIDIWIDDKPNGIGFQGDMPVQYYIRKCMDHGVLRAA